jgi:hypothetical protein
MKDCYQTDYTSIVALVVAVIALIVGVYAIRYQIIALLSAQLADKAKESNEKLMPGGLSIMPPYEGSISTILSSIITAEEILNYQVYKNKYSFLSLNVQSLVDQFYLQLHTTIREFIAKDLSEVENLMFNNQILKDQFNRAKEFLSLSIAKNERKIFEAFHAFTVKRNRKNQSHP